MSKYLEYGVKSYFEDNPSFENYENIEQLARGLADITLDQLEDSDAVNDIGSANIYVDAIVEYTAYVKDYILKEYGNPFKEEAEAKAENKAEAIADQSMDVDPLYDLFFKKQVIQFEVGDILEMRCKDGSIYHYTVVDRTSRNLRVKGKSNQTKTLRISKVQVYGATYTEEVSTYNASCRASIIRKEASNGNIQYCS